MELNSIFIINNNIKIQYIIANSNINFNINLDNVQNSIILFVSTNLINNNIFSNFSFTYALKRLLVVSPQTTTIYK